MGAFRVFLAVVFAGVFFYTATVGITHGWNLLPIFFGDIMAMTWAGQFNMDFTCFLLLSGLWLAWRHDFSPSGIALGAVGVFGGILVLAPYLLAASLKARGRREGPASGQGQGKRLGGCMEPQRSLALRRFLSIEQRAA